MIAEQKSITQKRNETILLAVIFLQRDNENDHVYRRFLLLQELDYWRGVFLKGSINIKYREITSIEIEKSFVAFNVTHLLNIYMYIIFLFYILQTRCQKK